MEYSEVKALQTMLAEQPDGTPDGLDHETSVAIVDQLLASMEALRTSESREADARTQKRRQDVARATSKPLPG
jgi:hypothetical protein